MNKTEKTGKGKFAAFFTKEIDYAKERKFFKVVLAMPKIASIAVFALFFIWAIVDTAAFHYSYGGGLFSKKTEYWGVMRLENGFVNWLIWFLIGAVLAAVVYFALRAAYCYKALVIANLEQLSGIQKEEAPAAQAEQTAGPDLSAE